MTVSISRMDINYYLSHAATGDGVTRDLTSYYTEAQAPPGRWFGAGLSGLPGLVAGDVVTAHQARQLYELQQDPVTGHRLGRPLMRSQATPKGAKTPAGREAKPERTGVAGFDLTFSPPKSVSALWAIAGPALQGEIQAAHQQATAETLRWVERRVLQSRAGHGGVAHVEVTGMLASLFEHWDSRAGDPQLHTHAVIANRVQRVTDAQWVTLDSYTLHRHVVAISETYNSLLFDRLADRVGALAESRTAESHELEQLLSIHDDAAPKRHVPGHRVELAGVPDRLIEEFSTRSVSISARTDELIERYVETTGRKPSAREVLMMRQQATLENRPDKSEIPEVTLAEKIASWRSRAQAAGTEPAEVIAAATGHEVTRVTGEMLDTPVQEAIASWALADASSRRTTFTRANVHAATERVLRLVRCPSAAERERLVDGIVDQALEQAVSLTPHRSVTADVADPSVTHRGASVFDHHRHAGVYTTQTVMDDEAYLIERTTSTGSRGLSPESATSTLTAWRSRKGHPLSDDQLAASVHALSTESGISAIIGPAGTGKTTTMAAISETWQREHHADVVGLAPSAVAAGVLADEIGVSTDNVTKWLYESVGDGAAARAARTEELYAELSRLDALSDDPQIATRRDILHARLAEQHARQAAFTMRPGQLIIIDEASMVPTHQLAELARQAEAADAKLLLVGDPAQLEAVEAGGFLGHIERNLPRARAHLSKVWRFENEWEQKASLKLRTGQTGVLQKYDEEGRLHGDPDSDATEAAYAAWKDDQDEGRSTILIAADNATVAELNARAHLDRVAAGTVDVEHTAHLRDGNDCGAGDVILARRNDRRLRDSGGAFVTNGTRMTVTRVRADGALDAVVDGSGATIVLDADYVAGSLELGYASTAHRCQGITVDTAHAIANPGLPRELLYVAMTRGRQSNDCYVDFDTDVHSPDQWNLFNELRTAETPVDVLSGVLSRAAAERSAHEVAADELGKANDVGRLCHEADYLRSAAKAQRTRAWVEQHFTARTAEQLYADPEWQRLAAADPAQTHNGQLPEQPTVREVLAGCRRPPETNADSLLPDIEPATPGQEQLWEQLQADFTDQLNARMAVLRKDEPPWLTEFARRFPHAGDEQLRAVLAWRAVSDFDHPEFVFGQEPAHDNHLRPYWQRLQSILHRAPADTSPDSEHPQPEPEADALPFDDIDWDAFADSADLAALDEIALPPDVDAAVDPLHWQTPAPHTAPDAADYGPAR